MDSVILAVEVTCRLREVLAAHARKEPLLCGMVASESCPVGMVAEKAGSSACSACPAGKYERLRQFCSDCSPGTISAAGR